MKFLTVSGKPKNVTITKYLVDWNRKVSAPQKLVKDFLKPYWKADVILEEFILPGSLLRADLININKNILLEISPAQHFEFNSHFHKTKVGYLNSIKRDFQKEQWAIKNGFKFVEIIDEDMEKLSRQLFWEKFDIML